MDSPDELIVSGLLCPLIRQTSETSSFLYLKSGKALGIYAGSFE
jgi:hypothetical protein